MGHERKAEAGKKTNIGTDNVMCKRKFWNVVTADVCSCKLSHAAATLRFKANTRWCVLDLNNTGCHLLNILHLLERQRVWIYTRP